MGPKYSNLEEYIMKYLKNIDIYHPHQLNIENIYPRIGFCVHYIPHNSMFIAGNMFLDQRKSCEAQWQDFGHELCHSLWHAGDQALIPLSMRQYQEFQADNFAQNFCIPSFMLDNLELPAYKRDATWMLQETFGVEHSFAQKRLEQYARRLCNIGMVVNGY